METADRALIETATVATAAIVLGGIRIRRHPFVINFLLAGSVFTALVVYGYRIRVPPLRILDALYLRVFNGYTERNCLLLFWLMCIVASVIFVLVVNATDSSTTQHRKFFHLTVSLIAVSGFRFDPVFARLSAVLIVCIFVILETLRALHVPPWSSTLNAGLLVFVDGQDSPSLILTPIFLQIGIFFPVLIDPIGDPSSFGGPNSPFHLHHLAGVLAVGVGDSAAAIVGSRFGRRRWSLTPGKSLEGSMAFAIAFLLIALLLNPQTLTLMSLIRVMVAGCVCAVCEAHLKQWDNIILPVVAYLIL